MSDKSKPPDKQPLLITLYDDLQTSFAFHKNHDCKGKKIHLSPRIQDVRWTRCGPEGDVLWGNVDIGEGELELMTVEDRATQQTLKAIRLGVFNGFPLTNSIVFYCCEDDMIYFYPFEGYTLDKPSPYHLVYPFRRFVTMVDEFR